MDCELTRMWHAICPRLRSWQWVFKEMLAGAPMQRSPGGWMLWNIVDVRDCGTAHRLALESPNVTTGDRFLLSASSDSSGELATWQLQDKLREMYPHSARLALMVSAPKRSQLTARRRSVLQSARAVTATRRKSSLGCNHTLVTTASETQWRVTLRLDFSAQRVACRRAPADRLLPRTWGCQSPNYEEGYLCSVCLPLLCSWTEQNVRSHSTSMKISCVTLPCRAAPRHAMPLNNESSCDILG
eukprot:SAG11_NODE_509_length_8856_cov_2.930798_5_plen_243_part_00